MKSLIVGGAGFVGSHLTAKLLVEPDHAILVYDNFSSGTDRHLAPVRNHGRLQVIKADVKDLPVSVKAQKLAGMAPSRSLPRYGKCILFYHDPQAVVHKL